MPARSPSVQMRLLPLLKSPELRSRSSAPDRAACIGWSRWSNSRLTRAASPSVLSPKPMCHPLLAAFQSGGDHALRLGLTEELPWLKKQTRLTFVRCGVVDPRSIADYCAHDGYHGLTRALTLTSAEIIADVTKSGLRGRGGAGFPTGIKWKTVADTSADRKFIVCNADEGDSGTFADRMIMEGDPFVVIEGMTIAGIAVGATKGYIYIRSEYPHAVDRDEGGYHHSQAREISRRQRICGSSHNFDLEVRVGAGAYVCGEETSLLESLEGRRGIVRAKPPLPAHKGSVRQAHRDQQCAVASQRSPSSSPVARKAYADFGMGRSRGTMPIQLAGNVKHGGSVRESPSASRSVNSSTISAGGTFYRSPGPRGAGRRPAWRVFPARVIRYPVRL